MGRKKLTEELAVYFNTENVGSLKKASTGAMSFQYAQTWLESPSSRAISRSLPLTDEHYRGDQVANFFDNLLPDNIAIRRLLAQKTKAKSERPFDLLATIGRDCVGSLLLLPEGEEVNKSTLTIQSRKVSDTEIAAVLQNLGRTPLGVDAGEDFRISIAGAQEKTAFLKLDGEWHIPQGATPTTHIFKIPMGVIQSNIDMSTSVENEWLCLEIFRQFGLEVSKAEIATFAGQKALVVERFDRTRNATTIDRIHQEDFCQALGFSSSLKYQSDGGPGANDIVEVLRESSTPLEDRRAFMKAQVLNWLIGAPDGHAKNFSVFIEEEGIRLTPFYDVMSAFPVVTQGQMQYARMKLAMRICKGHYHMDGISRRHFLEMAKESRFPVVEMEAILNEITSSFDQALAKVKARLPDGFPAMIYESVIEGMKRHIKRLKP